MKIIVLTPRVEFTKAQQETLSKLGQVVYTDSRRRYSVKELIKLARGCSILAVDPDNLGGFEVAPDVLPQILGQNVSIQHLALSTTSYGYIDKQYCQKKGIQVSNVPHYSSESVAEHAITLLLGCSKRIFLSDRRTQEGRYKLKIGYEVAGKTLGIIGLGSIGQRTAQLAIALGMKVIAWNRTPRQLKGVRLQSLDRVLAHSNYLSLHLIDNPDTEGIISAAKIAKLKRGVMIVNTASRDLVDEVALAKALKSSAVDSYALEAEDVTSKPLGSLENAFLFKGFGWYTQEALTRNKEIWVDNIISMAKGKPKNLVSW